MKLNEKDYYKLLIRPVNIITTISEDGKVNAAPFSFNTPISFSPPLYCFSCSPMHDTWTNIRKTREFVVMLEDSIWELSNHAMKTFGLSAAHYRIEENYIHPLGLLVHY